MQSTSPTDRPPVLRSFVGGLLMGLANLVPGVSGGTMILAVGLYDRFIGAVAELTSLRWSRALFVFLAALGVGLVVAIVGFSGVAVHLVTTRRWIMYSLFIGMALGGVPQLARLCRPFRPPTVVAFLAGLALMAWLAFSLSESAVDQTLLSFALVGALAASSMILPGISGSYILLLFGMYDVVIGSVSLSELRADPAACLRVVVPVGVGAVLGIALLSNVLKAVLARFSAPAHGALLGLLIGSVLGLWPFQRDLHPDLVERSVRKSVVMLVEGAPLDEVRARYEVDRTDEELTALAETYAGSTSGDLKRMAQESEPIRNPAPKQVGLALAIALAGFLFTWRLGAREAAPD